MWGGFYVKGQCILKDYLTPRLMLTPVFKDKSSLKLPKTTKVSHVRIYIYVVYLVSEPIKIKAT